MKKILLSLSLVTVALAGKAQVCSDLIISEYVEGTGNNKALEIYNASSTAKSLSNYRIVRYDNGATSLTAIEGEMNLPTNITLAPYATYVIALNLTDPAGTGQNAPIDVALQAVADTLLCPGCATGAGQSRVLCFNGDDALALQKNVSSVWTNVDIFACIGERPSNNLGTFSPGAGWTIIPPFESMPSSYNSSVSGPYFKQYWTQDKTLKRKNTIKSGVATNPGFQTFNASVQWDSLPVNTYSGLGVHVCDCKVVGVKELANKISVSIYPNPAISSIVINTSSTISKIDIYTVNGQLVKSVNYTGTLNNENMNVSDLTKGFYFITVSDKNNNQTTKKLIIE